MVNDYGVLRTNEKCTDRPLTVGAAISRPHFKSARSAPQSFTLSP